MPRRNPRECAVAKNENYINPALTNVATRTNALWQRPSGQKRRRHLQVATRTNALWQSCLQTSLQDTHKSQPARMRCGKAALHEVVNHHACRNPRECAEAKTRHCCARTRNPENMNYVLLFLVSLSVMLVVTFYMIAQLLKRFSTCTAKTAASKLSDAAVYSFNK